jgi:hypothetical protein
MEYKTTQILIGSALLLFLVRLRNKGGSSFGQYPRDIIANYALAAMIPGYGLIKLSANLLNIILSKKSKLEQQIPTLPGKGGVYGLR